MLVQPFLMQCLRSEEREHFANSEVPCFYTYTLRCSLLGPRMWVQHRPQLCFSAPLSYLGTHWAHWKVKEIIHCINWCKEITQKHSSAVSTCNCSSLQRTWAEAEEGVLRSHCEGLAGFLGELYSAVRAPGYVERSFIQFIELQPACERSFMGSFLNVTVLKTNSLTQNCAAD